MNAEKPEPWTWKFYDDSILPELILHDAWSAYTGIALVCNINPVDSCGLAGKFEAVEFDPNVLIYVLSHPRNMDFELTSLYDDEDEAPDLTTSRDLGWQVVEEIYPKRLQGTLSFHQSKGDIDDNISLYDLFLEALHSDVAYRRNKSIFDSNPNHTDRFSPKYFIDWANSKNIDIPWLEWAQDRGFVEGTTKAPEKQEPDLTTKKRRNYLTVIAALLKHHGYDLDKAPAESISMITAEYGRPIGTKTIRGYIKEIREEIEPDIDPR